jgi:hypothetical protein
MQVLFRFSKKKPPAFYNSKAADKKQKSFETKIINNKKTLIVGIRIDFQAPWT